MIAIMSTLTTYTESHVEADNLKTVIIAFHFRMASEYRNIEALQRSSSQAREDPTRRPDSIMAASEALHLVFDA